MRGKLTYANVMSTLAFFVAVGGSAYAVSNVGSGDITDNSVRSIDLKDRHGVKGRDLPRNALGGREIDEAGLNAFRIVRVAGDESLACDPTGTGTECAHAIVRLPVSGRILAIATGGEESPGAAARAACELRFDGVAASSRSQPGELLDNTDGLHTNGFARTRVSDLLDPGSHRVALFCQELAGDDVRIDAPTIAAIAINEPK